jgi:hypothetical protein
MCWRAVPRPTARRRRLPATAPLTVCGLVPGDRDSLKEERLRMFRIVSNDCATPAARHLLSAATFLRFARLCACRCMPLTTGQHTGARGDICVIFLVFLAPE